MRNHVILLSNMVIAAKTPAFSLARELTRPSRQPPHIINSRRMYSRNRRRCRRKLMLHNKAYSQPKQPAKPQPQPANNLLQRSIANQALYGRTIEIVLQIRVTESNYLRNLNYFGLHAILSHVKDDAADGKESYRRLKTISYRH